MQFVPQVSVNRRTTRVRWFCRSKLSKQEAVTVVKLVPTIEAAASLAASTAKDGLTDTAQKTPECATYVIYY